MNIVSENASESVSENVNKYWNEIGERFFKGSLRFTKFCVTVCGTHKAGN